MAGCTLDRFTDKSAPAEEQAKRKRRLLKGPSEFREMRETRLSANGEANEARPQ